VCRIRDDFGPVGAFRCDELCGRSLSSANTNFELLPACFKSAINGCIAGDLPPIISSRLRLSEILLKLSGLWHFVTALFR